MGNCFKGREHQPQRMQLNDHDDVTKCSVCQHWIQVHHDVRKPKGKK